MKAYIFGNMGHITCIVLACLSLNLSQTWPQGGPDPVDFLLRAGASRGKSWDEYYDKKIR